MLPDRHFIYILLLNTVVGKCMWHQARARRVEDGGQSHDIELG